VSAETVSHGGHGAVRWTSRTSGQRPAAGAAGRLRSRDSGGRASSRLGAGWLAAEEQRSKGLYLL